ncbi:MAG: XRE family transcriptional regulator [Myxococcota bacterium]
MSDSQAPEISQAVAENLRRIRAERNLSLSQLAELTGVSRAMLNQIEREKSAPTINVVFKITTALGLPFSALLAGHEADRATLLPADRSWQLRSQDGSFSSRALFPLEGPRTTEFYELRVAPGAVERADAHRPGTRENIVVNQGRLRIELEDETFELGPGDAIVFGADCPHAYMNETAEPVLAYLVITYS